MTIRFCGVLYVCVYVWMIRSRSLLVVGELFCLSLFALLVVVSMMIMSFVRSCLFMWSRVRCRVNVLCCVMLLSLVVFVDSVECCLYFCWRRVFVVTVVVEAYFSSVIVIVVVIGDGAESGRR